MSCPHDFLVTYLSALRLSRELAQEFPYTGAMCVNNPALANELVEAETLLSDVLRELSILRSQLRPINRLPPELLSHIFSFLGGGARVVPASHVCQHWRAVALSTPLLWTTVRVDDPFNAAQCFMGRSGNMKLDVSWPIHMLQEGIYALEATPASFAARIWRLHVVVYGERVSDFYRALAKCDLYMPALEHFSLIMIEYVFPDNSIDMPFDFFAESGFLTTLTFRAALPPQMHLSPAFRSLTLSDRVFDLDALLCCLASAPNLEYLALLDSVPHTVDTSMRPVLVTLASLREFHWFQGRVFDNVLGTVKLFEHLVLPRALPNPQFVLLLDPTKYAVSELYEPCERSTTLFSAITELTLDATHYAPDKPARNNIVFHGLNNAHDTLFSVRVHRVSLESLCAHDNALLLTSSFRADLSSLTHLTLTSTRPYNWNRFFFRGPASWARFFRCMPAVRVLRLYVSRPADIIAALLASADTTTTDAATLLPALRTLHLFRCGANANANDGEKVLMRFLKSRADLGVPIESIVCAAPTDVKDNDNGNGNTDAPDVLSFVDEVEFGAPGSWADPPAAFPRRMATLLAEHLN